MNTDPLPSRQRRRVMAAEVALALLALLFLWPFGVMLSTSLRDDAYRASHRSEFLPRAEYVQRPGGQWREVLKKQDLTPEGKPGQARVEIGDWTGRIDKTVIVRADEIQTRFGPTMRPYFHGLLADGFARRLGMTLIICVVAALALTCTSALAAYAFSILRWPGRNIVFYVVLGALLVPPALILTPLFEMYAKLGLAGTYVPLLLPAFLGNVFFVFLLRQFFLKVPRDLVDAARLEGSTEWQVFTGVVLPAAWPALALVAVLAFVWQGGEVIAPLLYASGSARDTFSEGLVRLREGAPKLQGELMAMCAVSIVPVALVVFLTRKVWRRGLRAMLPVELSVEAAKRLECGGTTPLFRRRHVASSPALPD